MGRIDTTTNAALLQSGVMGGWNQYQQDQRFQLAQEQQALDQLRTLARIRAEDENMAMAREDRALRAKQYAAQQQAIRNLHKNLLSFGQSPAEAGGMAMGGEPGSFTNTLSGGQQAYQATVNPMASPLGGMSDTDFAALPEGLRSKLVGDDMETSRAFRAAKARFEQLRSKGLLSRTSPDELKALADWGLLNNVSDSELGQEGRLAAVLGDEASRPALLDFLASADGGQIDEGLRQRFAALTTPELRKLTDRKMEAEDRSARAAATAQSVEQSRMRLEDQRQRNRVELAKVNQRAPSASGAMGSTSLMIGEERVSLPTGRGQSLAWDANDPVVRAFIDAAEKSMPKENLPGTSFTRNLVPDIMGGTTDAEVQAYQAQRRAQVEQTAKTLAQRTGWQVVGTGVVSGHVNATMPIEGDGFDEAGFQAATDAGEFDQDIAAMAEQGLSDQEIEQRLRQAFSGNRGQ